MAEIPHGFSAKDAKRIGRATKYVEGVQRGHTGPIGPGTGGFRWKVWGKLLETLAPGGSSTMEVWTVDWVNGGLGVATGEVLTIVDADQLSLDTTLPIGTPCSAVFGGGGWVLDGYRCQS